MENSAQKTPAENKQKPEEKTECKTKIEIQIISKYFKLYYGKIGKIFSHKNIKKTEKILIAIFAIFSVSVVVYIKIEFNLDIKEVLTYIWEFVGQR